MREILFRGKRIDTGAWVYGQYAYLLNARTEDGEPIRHMIVDGTPFGQTVDPSTVGQYTGLTGKNGNKVFEGDICKGSNILHTSRKIYQVRFEDGLFGLYDDGGTLWHYDHIDDVEVIGNIYDNPELLEGD